MPRAAELLRRAADAGSPEAQYALATLYKEGNGVPKDPAAAAKLLAAAARSGNIAAEVEYAVALFNGTGISKDESAAAAMFQKAAQKGNPVAQNRFARILATGRGMSAESAWPLARMGASLRFRASRQPRQAMAPAKAAPKRKAAVTKWRIQ